MRGGHPYLSRRLRHHGGRIAQQQRIGQPGLLRRLSRGNQRQPFGGHAGAGPQVSDDASLSAHHHGIFHAAGAKPAVEENLQGVPMLRATASAVLMPSTAADRMPPA